MAGWMTQWAEPSPEAMTGFLSASAFNAGFGIWGGVGGAYTPGSGTAVELGVMSPQVGASYHYSWEVYDAHSQWW
jgi:hypothetical protein